MADENTFKAGDVCLDCQQLGFVKYLRYFKINLNGDTLLKCESNECMYPYNDEFSSTDEEENDNEHDNDINNSLSETNSIKLIDDLLQQIKNETAEQNTLNSGDENINKNTEEVKNKSPEVNAPFEISFFDTFEEIVNENLSKASNIETETIQCTKVNETPTHNLPSLPVFDVDVMEQGVSQPIDKCDKSKVEQSFSLPSLVDTQRRTKPKINIQSVETIKTCQFNENNLFTSMTVQSNVSTYNTSKTAPTASSEPSVENLKPLVKTRARKKTNVSANRIKLKDPHESSSNLSANSSVSSTETKTTSIPKANIMKGSDFLKKLAMIDEKTPKYNPKCKEARKRASIKQQKDDINLSHSEETQETEVERAKPAMNFSLEAIAELLNANKKKNAKKNK